MEEVREDAPAAWGPPMIGKNHACEGPPIRIHYVKVVERSK